MVNKIMALAIVAGILAFGLAGCGNSSASNVSSSSEASAQSATQVSESSSAEIQDSTVFGDPQIVNVLSGSGSVIGTCSIFHAPKSDCTKENLEKWCAEYVQDSTDNWCVIVYSDDSDHGVYANNGMLQVSVGLEKDDNDGSYMVSESDESTLYVYDQKTKTLK